MAILKLFLFSLLMLMASKAQACPACLAANNGQFFNQTLLAVGIMGLLPLVLAFFIGMKIFKLCQSEEPKQRTPGCI